jgi:hypothetical protein
MKKSGVFITLLMSFLLLNTLLIDLGTAKIQESPLLSFTFFELGYNTTNTYHYNDHLSLNINCTGSSSGIYTAKIYLHLTTAEIYYYYQINGSIEIHGGGHEDYFTGWDTRFFDPGNFLEGVNSLRINFYNIPLSLKVVDPRRYLTILPDSYIEIYDATALPMEIEWQGYEINEANISIYFLIIEKLTRQPINTANVTIESDLANTTASFQGDGLYVAILPIPQQNVSLRLFVDGEGYESRVKAFAFSVSTVTNSATGQVPPSNLNLLIGSIFYFGILIGSIITLAGLYAIKRREKMLRLRSKPILKRSEQISAKQESTIVLHQGKAVKSSEKLLIDNFSQQEFVVDRDIQKKMVEMIKRATKEILIASPWIWESQEVLNFLERMVKEKKISIRIITRPVKSKGDKKHEEIIRRLNRLGFKIELEETLHAKLLLIDDIELLIGSANLVGTSLKRNYETSIWTKDPRIVRDAKNYFTKLIDDIFSKRLNKSVK